MKPEKPKKLGFRKIYYNLDKILFLFFLIFMMVEFVWLPLNSWIAGILLKQTGYLFISYTNFFAIVTNAPLVSLAFLVLIFLNFWIAYYQISLLFIGARHLLYHEKRTLLEFTRRVFREGLDFMRCLTFGKLTFIFLYVALVFPFIRKILRIYYFDKIVIPDFIMTYIEDKYWLVSLFVFIFAVTMLYISVRLMFALPKIFFERRSVKEALAYSVEKTRKQFRFYAWNLLWIVIKTNLFFFLLLFPLLVAQFIVDSLTQKESLILGVLNFVLMKNFQYMALTYFLVKFVSFLTGEELEIMPRRKKDHLMRWGVMGCASIFFAVEGFIYLQAPVINKPLVISHRGVSNENGVQNTIESLEQTVPLKPDLVEMDVQETKDGQFVVMHDPTLKALAGLNAYPQDLTLAELEATTISENGYQTTISSFDAYLKRANELQQKLLIEIKTSKKDSPQMMERFMEKYGTTIKQYKHQMQSLDYHVVDQVLKYDASIPIYFILPYNSIFPRTQATGYTMEYSTLDEYFVTKLWSTDQKLYAWTINTTEAFDKTSQLGVDGVITDDVEMVKGQLELTEEDPEYTELLLKKATEFFNY
ncbi:Glycerophosphoryl diester phosphodiesterase [Streptococcus oralis]|uniref:Glycerophosphoryl diester phosphodiesterase n=1 Tax=Streptococcus oralis TaxID=1303 RepID=A0A139RJA0_STROR|nr:glycerophosphodiester phosphodiesterase [Streptococcus oralis]KXU14745.1 Glycerophosphoryl diester phosphodiesterase [Streptococcus oralis]